MSDVGTITQLTSNFENKEKCNSDGHRKSGQGAFESHDGKKKKPATRDAAQTVINAGLLFSDSNGEVIFASCFLILWSSVYKYLTSPWW